MYGITELLGACEAGNQQATGDLFALVYDELRQLAVSQMVHENSGNTLQPTALVHEAYLRLLGDTSASENGSRWRNRSYFFAAAAEAMRRILIESARRKKRRKHGGGRARESLDPDQLVAPERAEDLLALDKALTELAIEEPQVAQLVSLRYFGGLTLREVAAVLGISPRTADFHWAYARAWLLTEVKRHHAVWDE